jgi:hypothetical protein
MKTAAILLATLSLGCAAASAAAAASEHLTDVAYLQANRCRGLAAGLRVSDTGPLDSLIKTEGRSRLEMVYARGQQEQERGKREASNEDSRQRLTAELNGPSCQAFLSGAKDVAATAR